MTNSRVGNNRKRKPLEGLRVLELGQLLAGPFAGTLLAWYGAEVIKVESPGEGDPLRKWRAMYKGTSLWWYAMGRNKKCITVNLRKPQGQELIRKMASKMDVVIENFRPGTLEKWNLGYDDLKGINPGIILVRVSGWGQSGPNAPKPGFASVAEGVGGLRFLMGYPDRVPVRANLSLGDTMAGLHAALGVLIAVYNRDVAGTGKGQVVDVAIYESIFNLMEGLIPEYDKCGIVREREGSHLSGIVPTGTYLSGDGKYIIVGGNGDAIFKRLMYAINRADMATDPRLEHNDGRVEHEQEIEDAISNWTSRLPLSEACRILDDAEVPAGPIYSVADMLQDAHFQARGLFEDVPVGDDKVKLPMITPIFSETPGGTQWPGPPVGAHNKEILGELLGLSEDELHAMAVDGII